MIIKECGELLCRLEEQRAQGERLGEVGAYAAMIREYHRELLRLERMFRVRDLQKYLEIRRARCAVKGGMEKTIPRDMLYRWIVQNLCDLESE